MKTLVASRSPRAARELIAGARSLGPVVTLLLGPPADDLGCDEVLWFDDPALAESPGEVGVAVLEAACRQASPDLILLPADSDGADWAPRLAWRLQAGLVTDCVGWDEELRFRRPVYGGKALAVFAVHTPVRVAVVRPGTFAPAAAGPSPVRRLEVAVPAERPRIVEQRRDAVTGPSLEEAAIVVSGGRGVGGAEHFEQLRELASVLGAGVGASRAAVDEGWVPASWQVGQTGKAVRPDLYIAIGISGASQHMAGVSGAKHIVAINTDAEAPIFAASRLGVVADYRQVLPALAAALREQGKP